MAAEIEVVRLVAKFVADTRLFKQTIKETDKIVDKARVTIEEAGKKGKEAGKRLVDTVPGIRIVNKELDKAATTVGKFGRHLLDTLPKMTEIHKEADKIKDKVSAASKSLGGMATKLTEVSTATKLAIGSMAAAANASLFGGLMKAGQFEQTKIAYETLLGSVRESNQTLADLTEFAAKTPFEMPEIQVAARGLITFGERGKELIQTLTILGNAASGTSSNFGELALIFNQIRGVGKLLTQDFRQLSTRGVLFLQDIAKHYRVTEQEANAMISSGKISFEELKKILQGLSEEGGRFNNMMEKQSQSLLGLWSTYQDAVGITRREIGEYFVPAAKAAVNVMIQLTEKFRELPPWIKGVTAAVLGLVAAIGAATTIWTVAGGVILKTVAILKAVTAATWSAVLAMTGLNVSMVGVTGVLEWYTVMLARARLAMLGFAALGAGLILLAAYKLAYKDVTEEINNMRTAQAKLIQDQQARFVKFDEDNQSKTGTQQYAAISEEIDKMTKKVEILNTQMQRNKGHLENVTEGAEWWKGMNWALNNELKIAQQRYESGAETLDVYTKRLNELKEKQRELKEIMEQQGKATAEQVENAKEYVETLKKQVEYETYKAGGGTDSRTIYDMMKQGVPPDLIQSARQFEQQISAIEERQKKAAEAKRKEEEKIADAKKKQLEAEQKSKQVIDSLKSPYQKLKETMMEMLSLHSQGLLTGDQVRMSVLKSVQGVMQQEGQGETAQQNVPAFAQSIQRMRGQQYSAGSSGLERSNANFRIAQYENLGMSRDQALAQVNRDVNGTQKSDTDRVVTALGRIEELLRSGNTLPALNLLNDLPENL